MSNQNYLQQALRMASYGVRVVFFKSGSKACKVAGWEQIASSDASTIEKMAAAKPDWTNYACVTKAEEGGTLIFDDDAGVRADYEAKHGGMVGTVVVKTWSGKLQYHFKHTAKSIAFFQEMGKNFIAEKKPKGEKGEYWSLRMNNAYGVGPGSVVTEGDKTGEYSIAFDAAGIADCPDSLLDWCRSRYAEGEARESQTDKKSDGATAQTRTGGFEKPVGKRDWQKEINSSEPIEEGKRNDRLLSLAGHLHHALKFGEEAILAVLMTHNERRCDPKLGADEIASIAKSAAKYDNGENREAVDTSEMSMEGVRKLVQLLLYTKPIERVMSGLDVPENAEQAANFASQVIYDHLKTRGKFYFADSVGYILLEGREDKPVPVSDEDAHFAQMLSDYGVNPGQDKQYKVGQFIWMKVKTTGEKATVCFSSHYNPQTKCFYFAEQAGFLIRVSAEKIDRVPNGTDGELFIFDEQTKPFSVDLAKLPKIARSLLVDENSLLMEYLFKDLRFVPSAMSSEDKKILLTTYIVLLVLSGVIHERPMLQMVGPSGCGKTFFLRCLGRVLVGPAFEVSALPDDKVQFENVLINNSLAFFDNVDGVPKTLRPVFCAAVTRFQVVRRELYTTASQMKVPSKATVGFSSLVEQLLTTEQTNRSLILNLLRRTNGNLNEAGMLERLENARASIVAEIIVRGQMVLRALQAQEKWEPRIQVRMAGVATLLLRVARHEGWEPLAQELLVSWNSEQLEGALKNDDVSEAIHDWITKDGWTPKMLTASEVSNELARQIMGENSWKGNAKALSSILQKSQESFAHRFGLIVGEDKHTHKTTFLFNPTEAQMSLLRAGKTNGNAGTAASVGAAVTPTVDSGDIWCEEGYRKGEGSAVVGAGVVKPGDYPNQAGYLTIADMAWIPKSDKISDDVKKGIEKWSRDVVAGGWKGGAMDVPAVKAVIQFTKTTNGRTELTATEDVTEAEWRAAFAQLAEVHRLGGDAAIQNCLGGHSPDRKAQGAVWTAGKRQTWGEVAKTEKGATSIRETYGRRAVCQRMMRFIYEEATL